MYNFLDNHDVVRLMSVLKNPDHAECCYTMMYGMYGVPSVYYGSEFGIRGEKGRGEDADRAIRPCLELDDIPDMNDKLMLHISELGAIRLSLPAVQSGSYAKIELKNQTFLFKRELNGEIVYFALNISDGDYTFRFSTPYGKLADRLSGRQFTVNGGNAEITVPKNKSMILVDGSAVQSAAEEKSTEPAAPAVPDKNNGIRGLGVPEGRKIVIGGHYKHFKGGEYVVLNVAKDHETCAEQAVYMQIHGKPVVWVRPLDMLTTTAM